MVSLLLLVRHSQCLRLTITQLVKQVNCAVAVDLSQTKANTMQMYYRCWTHLQVVGAKYVGCICTGLASVLSVVSGVWMSIPRNLVSGGRMDPGSIPPSTMTSVAGTLGAPAWFHEESDVELGEFMIWLFSPYTQVMNVLCFWCTTPMVSLLFWIGHSQCLRLTITQLAKQGNCAVAVDLSQINANAKHVDYRCWTHLQAPPLDSHLEYKLATWSLLSK